MQVKCFLLLLCYHLLLGGAMSDFTTTVYPAKVFSSSQCGQYSPYHEQLREVLQHIEQNIPKNTTCKCIYMLLAWTEIDEYWLVIPIHPRSFEGKKDQAPQCKCMESGICQLHVEDWGQ